MTAINTVEMYKRIRLEVTDDPIFDNFVKAFCDLTEDQRERFGKEYASILYDLIDGYPFDTEPPTFDTVAPRSRAR